MPLYTDPGYFISGGGGSSSFLSYPSYYSAGSIASLSSYSGYSRPLTGPNLLMPPTRTSYTPTLRYKPNLSTISETPITALSSRHSDLTTLTRVHSPKVSIHSGPKYVAPRPIRISTSEIDVSASKYVPHKRPMEITTATSPRSSMRVVSSAPTDVNNNESNKSSPFMPRIDAGDPKNTRGTIKRDRAIVRLSIMRPRKDSNKENDGGRARKISKQVELEPQQVEELDLPPYKKKQKSSWRDAFGDMLNTKKDSPKKSPGELLLERHMIKDKDKEDEYVPRVYIDVVTKPKCEPEVIKEAIAVIDEISSLPVKCTPSGATIRRVSLPKVPSFHEICEDISSDKIDDDLNAGELRRRASLIQEQEIEILNELQKTGSGLLQFVVECDQEQEPDDDGEGKSKEKKSVKRKSKKARKPRPKITATVEVDNIIDSPIIPKILAVEELGSFEESPKQRKPRLKVEVEDIQEDHTVHKIFKLPKKRPKLAETSKDPPEDKLKIEDECKVKAKVDSVSSTTSEIMDKIQEEQSLSDKKPLTEKNERLTKGTENKEKLQEEQSIADKKVSTENKDSAAKGIENKEKLQEELYIADRKSPIEKKESVTESPKKLPKTPTTKTDQKPMPLASIAQHKIAKTLQEKKSKEPEVFTFENISEIPEEKPEEKGTTTTPVGSPLKSITSPKAIEKSPKPTGVKAKPKPLDLSAGKSRIDDTKKEKDESPGWAFGADSPTISKSPKFASMPPQTKDSPKNEPDPSVWPFQSDTPLVVKSPKFAAPQKDNESIFDWPSPSTSPPKPLVQSPLKDTDWHFAPSSPKLATPAATEIKSPKRFSPKVTSPALAKVEVKKEEVTSKIASPSAEPKSSPQTLKEISDQASKANDSAKTQKDSKKPKTPTSPISPKPKVVLRPKDGALQKKVLRSNLEKAQTPATLRESAQNKLEQSASTGAIATPEPGKQLQRSESVDFWQEIGSRESIYMQNRKKLLQEWPWKREDDSDDSTTEEPPKKDEKSKEEKKAVETTVQTLKKMAKDVEERQNKRLIDQKKEEPSAVQNDVKATQNEALINGTVLAIVEDKTTSQVQPAQKTSQQTALKLLTDTKGTDKPKDIATIGKLNLKTPSALSVAAKKALATSTETIKQNDQSKIDPLPQTKSPETHSKTTTTPTPVTSPKTPLVSPKTPVASTTVSDKNETIKSLQDRKEEITSKISSDLISGKDGSAFTEPGRNADVSAIAAVTAPHLKPITADQADRGICDTDKTSAPDKIGAAKEKCKAITGSGSTELTDGKTITDDKTKSPPIEADRMLSKAQPTEHNDVNETQTSAAKDHETFTNASSVLKDKEADDDKVESPVQKSDRSLTKFPTVPNLDQCLIDVDAELADIEDFIQQEEDSDSSYEDDSSCDSDSLETGSMKKKGKKHGKKEKAKDEVKKFDPKKNIKLDHKKRCYVKDEAPPYPLIATPRPLWKREKHVYQRDSESESEESESDSECSTSDEYEDDLSPSKNGITSLGSSDIRMSTCSNDSGFEGGTAPSSPKRMLETSYTFSQFQRSGRITAPATVIPRFKKYSVEDFHFLAVLGKGSFGKVLLAELRNTEYYYAVKCLKKDVVLEDDDVECTLIERKVLALGTKHPYLCHLFCTFQTESHLFFVMEYLNGGDLMFHIQQSGRFPEPRARFYAAEIISGLKFLHKKGIVYRDLKLDNVLLDFDGHVRIADFGMCKLQIYLDKTADSFCGTPDYMAPEIIKGDKYNQNVDWWSFGVLLYEMLIGQSPFSGCDEDELFWSICNELPWFPIYLSKEAHNLLKGLLEKDSSRRIGSQYSPAGDVTYHEFFREIDWQLLEKRALTPPFKPQVRHPLDTQYFDKAFTRERVRLTPIDREILQSMDQAQFQGFSYTNPNATLN